MVTLKNILTSALLLSTGALVAISFSGENKETSTPKVANNIEKNRIKAPQQTQHFPRLEKNKDSVATPTTSNTPSEVKKDELIRSLTLKIEELENKLEMTPSEPQRYTTTHTSDWFLDNTNNKEDQFKKIEARFQETPYNQEDARQKEIQLSENLQNNENLSLFDFGDSECKKNTCRIQLAASDDYQLGGVIGSLNSEFSTDPSFAGKAFLLIPDPSTGLASIYVSDDESDLYPAHP